MFRCYIFITLLFSLLTLAIPFHFLFRPVLNEKDEIPLSEVDEPLTITKDSEKLSSAAIKRVRQRVDVLDMDSCKPSAQYVLYTVGGVDEHSDLGILNLTNITKIDIKNIKEKVMNNKIVQIETNPNHHFVIFKKNDEYLYLLQGFYNIYYLSEWINNTEVMKPHWKIDDFFDALDELLNILTPNERVMELLRELFYPSYFSTNQTLIKKFNDWFEPWLPVMLDQVYYVSYNFSKDLDYLNSTRKDFVYSASHYHL